MLHKIGIIVVNYNQLTYTKNCIDSLLKSDFQDFHIALIDNGSKKEISKQLAKEYSNNKKVNLCFLKENIGYAAGVNKGFMFFEGNMPDYFLILNNDTVIDSKAIKNLINASKRYENNAIVSGKVFNFAPKDSLQIKNRSLGLNQVSIVKNKNEKDIGQYDFEMELIMR